MERGERDPFEVLGVGRDASDAEIKAAYRRKAEICHPDRYRGRPADVQEEAARMMQELNDAREKIRAIRASNSAVRESSSEPQAPRSSRPREEEPQPPRPASAPRSHRPQSARRSRARGLGTGTAWGASLGLIFVLVLVAARGGSDDRGGETSASSTSPGTATTEASTPTTESPGISIPVKIRPSTTAVGMTVERLASIPVPECPVPLGEFGFVAVVGSADDPSASGPLEAVVGDLTGDGVADGAYISACNGGGSGVFYDTWVFDSSGALLGRLPVAQDANQDLSSLQYGLEVGAGTISVVAAGPTACTSCEPSTYRLLNYRWNGSDFDRLEDGDL